MDQVDVVLLTKNSEEVLAQCLESVYKSVPVRQLIVVDGHSTDKTLEILNVFNGVHGNIKIIYDNGTRATARQKGIRNVETDWFIFVDSDVVLSKNWFQKAMKYVDKNVGAIWGIEVWSTIQKSTTLKMFLWITRKIFELRGGTHDTLVRLESIKDIEIPNSLHVFEDAYIKEWITKKGYKIIACYDPYCIHYRPKNVWTLQGSLNIVMDAIRFGSFKLIVRLVLAYGFYTAYSMYQLLASRMKRHQFR